MQLELEIVDKQRHSHDDLHPSKAETNAVSGTISKGQEGASGTLFNLILIEPLWDELLWFGVELGIMVDGQGGHNHSSAFFNVILWSAVLILLSCNAD